VAAAATLLSNARLAKPVEHPTMNSPRPIAADAAQAGFSLGHFIAGESIVGKSGRTGEVFNPATGAVRGSVAYASADETRAAIAAAATALPAWSATPPLQRARIMFRFKTLLEAHGDELAGLITAEHGKVLSDARGEVTRGMEVVEFACGIPQMLKGEFSENVGTNVDSW
jgi:malonate-semialdehyde dehydrogenase (acetylating)/methylmalonate-semialdehyde dehydrogenase